MQLILNQLVVFILSIYILPELTNTQNIWSQNKAMRNWHKHLHSFIWKIVWYLPSTSDVDLYTEAKMALVLKINFKFVC